jgi:shikimate kinase
VPNPRSRLRALMDERRPIYESLASITVSTDGRSPDEVADEVARRLRSDGPAPGTDADAGTDRGGAP